VEVKPSVPRPKILRHVTEPYVCERETLQAKFTAISRPVSPASVLDISADNCQKSLTEESGIITNKMGSHNTCAVQGSPCEPAPL
jgi:hypothetical protein